MKVNLRNGGAMSTFGGSVQ
jgi:hypothetical protein